MLIVAGTQCRRKNVEWRPPHAFIRVYLTRNQGITSRIKHRLWPVLFLLCLLPALVGAAEPTTAVAEAGTWQPATTAFARVSARRQAMLGLPFAARIVELSVEPGARVAAGDELVRFDAPVLRQHLAAWQQALVEVRLANKRLKVLRQSESQHAITRRELVAGEQAVAQAQGKSRMRWETLAADLDLLHIQADKKTLEARIGKASVADVARSLGSLQAPFAGVVTERRVALGEQVGAGDPVLELEALEQVYLEVGVPHAALPIWKSGETRWYAGAVKGLLKPLDGAALYDANSGLWLLRYQADNPHRRLREGAWIEVKHVGAPEAVVWVPVAAVVARNGKTWCVVQAEDQFKPVQVEVGPAVNGRIPVLSGISAGDKVVTEGAYELLYRDLKELIKFVD